jgi:hypothetical protein
VNLGALRDRARALSGIRLQTLRSDEQVDAVLNEAYFEVINMTQWSFLRSSAEVSKQPGDALFTTPIGFSEVTSVTYIDDIQNKYRLQQTTLDEIDRLDSFEEGDPFYYARVNDSEFEVWPVPNKAITYTVKGKLSVEPLRADSDEPVFSDQFHVIIAYRAASRMLAEEGDDSGRGEAYQAEANMLFLRMQQYYTRTGDVGMFVMGGRRRRSVRGH